MSLTKQKLKQHRNIMIFMKIQNFSFEYSRLLKSETLVKIILVIKLYKNDATLFSHVEL